MNDSDFRLAVVCVFAAGITLGLATYAMGYRVIPEGTNDFSLFHFNGSLNGEKVEFAEMPFRQYSKLGVRKPDGRIATYYLKEVVGPNGKELELEVAVREAKGVTTEYDLSQLCTPGGECPDVVKEMKSEAAGYLERIAQANREGR